MRREQILGALRDAGATGVSGEALATELGVSRMAVAKHVAALREEGYTIDAAPGTGYRLVSSADAVTPAEVRPLVTSDFWTSFEGGHTTGSTNDDCIALARAGAAEGTVVLASAQQAGRGRLGRTWDSPEGGVYLSVLLRPEIAISEMAPLPLVVSLGVARAIEGLGMIAVRLKWPNDVWFEQRKLAGILLESSIEGGHVQWVVAGVGLNVEVVEGDREHTASYLRDRLPAVRRAEAAAAVLNGVGAVYREFLTLGFAALMDEYNARSAIAGKHVVVSSTDGAVVAEGAVAGVDVLGRLLLETPDGPVAIATGDVTLRRPTSS